MDDVDADVDAADDAVDATRARARDDADADADAFATTTTTTTTTTRGRDARATTRDVALASLATALLALALAKLRRWARGDGDARDGAPRRVDARFSAAPPQVQSMRRARVARQDEVRAVQAVLVLLAGVQEGGVGAGNLRVLLTVDAATRASSNPSAASDVIERANRASLERLRRRRARVVRALASSTAPRSSAVRPRLSNLRDASPQHPPSPRVTHARASIRGSPSSATPRRGAAPNDERQDRRGAKGATDGDARVCDPRAPRRRDVG